MNVELSTWPLGRIMYHSGQSLWWTIFYSLKYLGIRARPPRAATRPTPTRPRRSPRLPTRALKAKILPQSVGIRFVHCRLCPPGVISQCIAVPPKFSNQPLFLPVVNISLRNYLFSIVIKLLFTYSKTMQYHLATIVSKIKQKRHNRMSRMQIRTIKVIE